MPELSPPLLSLLTEKSPLSLGFLITSGHTSFYDTPQILCGITEVQVLFDYHVIDASSNDHHYTANQTYYRGGVSSDEFDVKHFNPPRSPVDLLSVLNQPLAVTAEYTLNGGSPVTLDNVEFSMTKVGVSDPQNGDVTMTDPLKYLATLRFTGDPLNLQFSDPPESTAMASIEFNDWDISGKTVNLSASLVLYPASYGTAQVIFS